MRRSMLSLSVLLVGSALVLASPAMARNLRFFQSPSGNIGCVMLRGHHGLGPGGVRCDIREHSWRPPPPPPSCDLDYGNGLEVGPHGKGRFVCAGDTTLGQGPHLAIGKALTFAGYRCKSLITGVRCVNRSTQHGFKIGRDVANRF